MTDLPDPLALTERDRLPDALRVLVAEYPRADWERHGHFGGMIAFWMQRHAMFRQLRAVLQADARAYIDGHVDFAEYAPRLSQHAGRLLNELHGHHHIEDSHYFPRLITLDARLERGFELLESDHRAMDGLLHGMAEAANGVLRAGDGADAGPLGEYLGRFGDLLERHLTDEEEIVVPVVLKTGFAG